MKPLIAVFVFMLSGCFYERQWDPRRPEPGRSGVVLNLKGRVHPNSYFVVQNLVYDPECSVYNNDGKFIYRFPGQFCLFLKNGAFVSFVDGQLIYFDSQMKEVWARKLDMHHDLSADEEREEIVVAHRVSNPKISKNASDDRVSVFNFKGETVYEWSVIENRHDLEKAYGKRLKYELDRDSDRTYLAKVNSVQILPHNRLESRHPEFKAGNILVNDRMNSHFIVLDRVKGIVWSKKMSDESFHSGHSPRFLPSGEILFYQNRVDWTPAPNQLKDLINRKIAEVAAGDQAKYINGACSNRQAPLFYSEIVRFDPTDGRVVWKYTPRDKTSFCTHLFGYSQPLENGNVLVSHISNGGAAFEIDSSGEIVWEWINPEREGSGRPKVIYKVTKVPKVLVDSLAKQIIGVQEPFNNE